MRRKMFALVIMVLLALPLGMTASALADDYWDYNWVGGLSGNWNAGTNWSPQPDPPPTYYYPNGIYNGAIVQGEASQDVTVYMNAGSIQLYKLVIGAGDMVSVNDGGAITIYSPSAYNNAGTLRLNGTSTSTGLYDYVNQPLTLAGGGTVEMAGPYSKIQGNSNITNSSGNSIVGQGQIIGTFTNEGTVTAKGGTLEFYNGTVTNNAVGGITTFAAGDALSLKSNLYGTGGIDPGPGTLKLNGAALFDQRIGSGAVQVEGSSRLWGHTTLDAATQVSVADGVQVQLWSSGSGNSVSGGTITLNGAASLYANNTACTLQNGAKVVLNGSSSSLAYSGSGNFTTSADSSIEGYGRLLASIVNNGTITARDGTLEVTATVTGTGKVSVADGATLNVSGGSGVTTGNFEMLGTAALTGGSTKVFTLSKNFAFTQTDESTWNSGAGFRLTMNGGGAQQSLEVGGLDSGAVADGFASNFHLDSLTVSGTNSYAYLADMFNNGNRGGSGGEDEALYVSVLQILTGTTLNLNGLHLYTMHDDSPYLITLADSGASWLGGGTIIDAAVPVPAAVWLLGTGLLGLGLPGLRRRKARR